MEDLAFGVACVEASGHLATSGSKWWHHSDLGIGSGRPQVDGFKYFLRYDILEDEPIFDDMIFFQGAGWFNQ